MVRNVGQKSWISAALAAIFVFAAVATGCGGDNSTSGASTGGGGGGGGGDELTTVRLADYGPTDATGLQMRVADEQGFFEKEGIKIKYVPLDSGALAVQALAGNSIDVMSSAAESSLAAYAQGAKLKMIASKNPRNLFTVMAAKDLDLPHESEGYPAIMQDFAGKKIGVIAHGTSGEAQFTALLKGAGMKPSDVEFVEVGLTSTAYPAIRAGRIDATVQIPPMQAICEATGDCRTVIDMTAGDGPPEVKGLQGAGLVYASSDDFISSNKDTVDGFIRAVGEASEFMKDPANREAVLKVAKEHFPIADVGDPEKVLEGVTQGQIDSVGYSDRQAIQRLADFMHKYGVLPKEVDVSGYIYKDAR